MRWLLLVALVACGSKDNASPTAGSGGAAKAKIADAAIEAPPPVAMGSDGVPLVCGDWKAAIDKLQTCTAIPANARESLINVYKEASTGWGQLPADAKRNLVTVCRAGADSVLKGAKATCGW
ncbi:MAG TPA: hypothetical protein VFQ65_29685 [Kofleriaceae bacterium]|nr:hypothetical protein [Kofleriaceae bacterium]